jgi:hypothetical protein
MEAAVAVVAILLALILLVVLGVVVMLFQVLRVLLALPIQVAEEVAVPIMETMAAQAVQVSLSSAIQTHSEPQQAQQVHQRLLWLEALGFTNLQPLVLLRSKMNALAHSVTAVGAGRSHGQEWMPCPRILRDCLHSPRSNHTAQRNDGVARQERRPLQVNRIHGDLEQFGRVGGYSRLHMAA